MRPKSASYDRSWHVTKRVNRLDNVRQCSWLLVKPETPTEVAQQRVTTIVLLGPQFHAWPPVRARNMDLPPIGAHCSLPSCRELDLLPIRCRCEKQFCKDHIFPDAHQCPVDPSQALKDASTPLQLLQRCAFASCAKPSLAAYVGDSAKEEGRASALCPRCTLAYCAS